MANKGRSRQHGLSAKGIKSETLFAMGIPTNIPKSPSFAIPSKHEVKPYGIKFSNERAIFYGKKLQDKNILINPDNLDIPKWLDQAKIKNGLTELNKFSGLRWHNGVWESGTWKGGVWHNGRWENGRWKRGVWKNGVWLDGTWQNGIWENGSWWNGTWKNGIWQNGTWYKGTWKDGEWEGGEWKGGYDKDGNFHPEGDSPDKWIGD